MARRPLSNYYNDIQFDWQWLNDYFSDDYCDLVILSGRDISILLSLLRYANWAARWTNYTDFGIIQEYIYKLEGCLMSGCDVSNLIKTNLMIYAAISGETINLDDPLPTGLFSVSGLTSALTGDTGNTAQAIEALHVDLQGLEISVGDVTLPVALTDAVTAISVSLSGILSAIEAADYTEDLEDDLANIWQKLKDISELLGADETLPPTPL